MTGLRIYKKIVDVLADFIYIVILLYAFVAIPYLFGFKPMIVENDNMNDAYSKGSIIYYHKTAKSNLKKGDVITFTYEGSSDLITQRITDIDGDNYKTKEDISDIPSPVLVPYSSIKGEVSKIYLPYLGTVWKYITSHIYLVVIAALILIAEFILNGLKIFNKDVYEDAKRRKKEQEQAEKEAKEKQITNVTSEDMKDINENLSAETSKTIEVPEEETIKESNDNALEIAQKEIAEDEKPFLTAVDLELPIAVEEEHKGDE